MTQANYLETVSTLLFGQKAKHVKTTVQLNEMSNPLAELQEAQKQITVLKAQLREYEIRFNEEGSTLHEMAC